MHEPNLLAIHHYHFSSSSSNSAEDFMADCVEKQSKLLKYFSLDQQNLWSIHLHPVIHALNPGESRI